MATSNADLKKAAVEQWTADPCGAVIVDGFEQGTREYFEQLIKGRFEYAPWMPSALGYDETAGLRVLDVGCGQGIDVSQYAQAGAEAWGVDLTPRHVELAKAHTTALGLDANIRQGDAETMPFEDNFFDRVSSNGVLHHTPDMPAALRDIRRVLKPGGEARVIVYNKRSWHYWVNQVLWHGIMHGQLIQERSMAGVLSANVEYSTIDARPLVKVYTPAQVEKMLLESGFQSVTTAVHHFNVGDTFVTGILWRLGLRSKKLLNWLGRSGGWYVIGTGRKSG